MSSEGSGNDRATLANGLALHTSNRLEVLFEDLAERLAAEPLPPLEHEVIVVQSLGMERWLRLELARRLGIAGQLAFPFPATLLALLADRLLDEPSRGARPVGRITDWSATPETVAGRDSLGWRLFGLLGDAEEESIALYTKTDPDQRKRYQLAMKLANLFDDYQMFRPDMVLAWEGGETPAEGPGAWQAPLWRRLMADEPRASSLPIRHGARRLTELLERLEREERTSAEMVAQGLPRRLSVFGVSTLPPLVLRLLATLARFVPVRLYFVSPTYHYWGDLRSEREQARIERRLRGVGRSLDEAHFTTGHRLLSSLGRQGRDFFNLLQAVDDGGNAWHELDFVEPAGDTVLARLQRDILHLEEPPASGAETARAPIAADDRSLRIHVAHSPMREMEILRDQLLAAFAEEESLRPDDVLVLVSDIERYSPYVEAVFGGGRSPRAIGGEDEPALPYAIADRRAGAGRPAAEAALRVLELTRARRTLGEVLDLLEVPAIRRRFGLEAELLPELRQRLARAGIRWGVDGAQRRDDFALPAEEANTWRTGLDRLLMGLVAGGLDALVAGIAPLAGDLPGDSDTLGRLAAYLETLFHQLDSLRERRSPRRWAEAVDRLLDTLFDPGDEDDELALQLVRDTLDSLRQAEEDGLGEDLELEVIRRHLARRLADDGGPGPFLTGRITFCALKPMRTIPFSVVCIAGLDDGVFPRRDPPAGFDLVRRAPRPGDRSQRDDDRYLFLETLLSAKKRLLLSTVGRSARDGSERAPSVVLSELLEHLDRRFVGPGGEPASRHLTVVHRLHPFHPAYFEPDPADTYAPWFSYSVRALAGARALAGPRRQAPPFVGSEPGPSATDGEDGEAVELAELMRFWVDPCRYYARQVLGVELSEGEDVSQNEAEPFAADGLEGYQIREWLLARRLRGLTAGADELALLRARGELPIAGLGEAEYQKLCRRVAVLCSALSSFERLPPRPFELEGEGWRLVGRLEGLTPRGALRHRCSGVRPSDRLQAWIQHLVVNLLDGESRTRLVGEHDERRRRDRPRVLEYRPEPGARPLLDTLIDGYCRGLERPLPVFPLASPAYAEQLREQDERRSRLSPLEAARRQFLGGETPGGFRWGDRYNPWIALCFRGREPLDHPEMALWAQRLWSPLLEHEEESA